MPHGKLYCATWHDLTPFKINDKDPLCISKTLYIYIYNVGTWHLVTGYNIVVNNGD
jgi:hypothetical protein